MDEQELASRAATAAGLVAAADALVFCSGAGLGVDSGVGTFRGVNAGQWPPLVERKLEFSQMSQPAWFLDDGDPELAFGFWFWRYDAYVNKSQPHDGYRLMLKWGAAKKHKPFSYTSNIDGHWIAAGLPEDQVVEIHGSVRYWQCRDWCEGACVDDIWPDTLEVTIDPATHKAVRSSLPLCKNCGKCYKRPNVCMFSDFGWNHARSMAQESRFEAHLETLQGLKVVVVECGAGTAIPSVRLMSERLCKKLGASLIRINLEESSLRPVYSGKPAVPGVSMACGALQALRLIDEAMAARPAAVLTQQDDFSRNLVRDYRHWAVYVHSNQSYLGRCVVWCKRPDALDLADATPDEQQELFAIARALREAASRAFKADLMNYAFLGNETRHLHGHFIPRYAAPRVFEGLEFKDERWGHNYLTNHDFVTPPDVLDKIRLRLAEFLAAKLANKE